MGTPRGHDPSRLGTAQGTNVTKRSVVVAGHRTSVSLEDAFWTALTDLARSRAISINALIGEIDQGRGSNLSSAIRVYVLQNAQSKALPS